MPVVFHSPLPGLANVLTGGAVYLATYVTLAPIFKAVERTDLEILAPILSRIRILRPFTKVILAYERWVINALEGEATTPLRVN